MSRCNYSFALPEVRFTIITKDNILPFYAMKAHRGIRGIVPLTSIIRWRWMVDFTPQLHYPRERTRVHSHQEAGWNQRCSGRFGKEIKKTLAFKGIRTLGCPTRNLVATPGCIYYYSQRQKLRLQLLNVHYPTSHILTCLLKKRSKSASLNMPETTARCKDAVILI